MPVDWERLYLAEGKGDGQSNDAAKERCAGKQRIRRAKQG